MACAIEMAEKMAQMSPVAIQGTKTSLNYSRDHSVEEGLEQIVRTIYFKFRWAKSSFFLFLIWWFIVFSGEEQYGNATKWRFNEGSYGQFNQIRRASRILKTLSHSRKLYRSKTMQSP